MPPTEENMKRIGGHISHRQMSDDELAKHREWLKQQSEEEERMALEWNEQIIRNNINKRIASLPARYRDGFKSFMPTLNGENYEYQIKVARGWADSAAGQRDWISKPISLYLYSSTYGSGKTHLAYAVLRQTIEYGLTVFHSSVPDFISKIHSTYQSHSEESEHQIITRAAATGVMLLDDLGAGKPTDDTLRLLYLVINKRYEENKLLVVTSNYRLYPKDEKDESTTIRDVMAKYDNHFADRIVDRLIEFCGNHQVDMPEVSQRKRK